MFNTNTDAAASVGGASNPWMLTAQDVLDYTSFSDDSHSPILSLDSFTSTAQHSPDMSTAFTFQEFAPLPTTVANPMFQDMSAFQPMITPQPARSDLHSETAQQAALLHAYLAAQTQANTTNAAQGQWAFPATIQSSDDCQQMQQHQQMQQQQQQREKEDQMQQQMIKEQDAQNLARYLAQSQQIKLESPSEVAMEHDSVSPPQSPTPSSASEGGDKSPSASPTLAERSLSPDAPQGSAAATKSTKPTRQLVCFNCKVTQTPLWRRTPDRKHPLCNACGLYYKQYGAHRPLQIRHKPLVLSDVRLTLPYARLSSPSELSFGFANPSSATPDSSASSDSDSDSAKVFAEVFARPPVKKTSPSLMTAKQGIQCVNCSQTQTPLWRKNDAGEPICNACGLYAKLHNRDRPVTMRKAKITRRRRDWGSNLALQAHAQAQALVLAHVQAQAQAQAALTGETLKDQAATAAGASTEQSSAVASIVEEMNQKAKELVERPISVHSSDSEEEDQEQQQQQKQNAVPVASPVQEAATAPHLGQSMSNNMILDENKFSDMVGQMNAHQMNRFLSILETRCGVLRERLLASTEASAQQSSFDHLF
ncbi:hypothetical protein BGZ51_008558 [Haplosporangium sp. Z 767]|nr:hypothetical protein BGZ51_008558 [Haplosporangium sp. Z 767]